MRKVVDKHTVAHMWANKKQDEARTSTSNLYFNGDTIYSYGRHFPIAKHVDNGRGDSAVLFTTRSYSSTTAQHISIVRSACSHLNRIYCYSPDELKSVNFDHYRTEIESIATKLVRAKKPEIYLNEIDQVSATARKYAEFWGVPIPESLQEAMNISSKDSYAGYNERKQAAALIEKTRREKELKKKHKEELKKWLSGESYSLYSRDGYDYLRVKDGRVQTSQRVELPIEMGKRLYQSIKEDTLKVGDKILNYIVNETGAVYRIGCHTFTRKYLLEFGSKL